MKPSGVQTPTGPHTHTHTLSTAGRVYSAVPEAEPETELLQAAVCVCVFHYLLHIPAAWEEAGVWVGSGVLVIDVLPGCDWLVLLSVTRPQL